MFCQNCGTERLGEAPFCQGCGASFDGPQGSDTVKQPQQTSGEAGLYFKKLYATIFGCFTAPASTFAELSKGGDFKTALGLMATQSVATVLAVLFFLLFIVSKAGVSFIARLDVGIISIILVCLLVPFGLAALFAAVLLLVNNVFFKCKNTYKEMLCVASGSSLAIAVGLCTASVIGFLFGVMNMQLGIYLVGFLMSIGTILSYFLTGAGLKGVGEPNDNKRLWILLCSFAIMVICNVILITKVVFPMIAPDIGNAIMSIVWAILQGSQIVF